MPIDLYAYCVRNSLVLAKLSDSSIKGELSPNK